MKFELAVNQPYIVKHRQPQSTAIVFVDDGNSTSWGEITATRFLDPLAIISVFYTHWDMISAYLANIFHIQDLKSAKLQSLTAFLDNTIPYRDEQSTEVRNALPLKLFSPKLVNNKLSFSVSLYTEPKSPKSHSESHGESQRVLSSFRLTYSIEELQQSYITSKRPVLENSDLIYQRKIPEPYLTTQDAHKHFKEGIPSALDTVFLDELKLEEIIPPFFVMLWKSIANNTKIAGLVRFKILISFYDTILTKHTSYPQQIAIEQKFTQHDVRNTLARAFNPAVKFSPDATSLETQLISASALPAYSSAALYAMSMLKFPLEERRISADYLVAVYDKLIKDESNAYIIYLILESLAHVIKASQPEHSLETQYLDAYLKQLENALYTFEYTLDQSYVVTKETKVLSPLSMIDEQADRGLETLKFSPQAWEALFNAMKIELALQHAVSGYPVQAQKGVTITNVFMNGTTEYVVSYLAPRGNTAAVKIKNTPALEKFLKEITAQEYSKLKAERVAEKASDDLQAGLTRLFSEQSAADWSAPEELKLAYDRLKRMTEANDSPFTVIEKRNLVVTVLIGLALVNPSLMTPIGNLLQGITGQDPTNHFITGSDLLNKITHYRMPTLTDLERNTRKAALILELKRLNVIVLNPEWFLSQENFNEQMVVEKITDKELISNVKAEDKARILMLRPKAKFVSTHFKAALGDAYPLQDDEIRLKISLNFYEVTPEADQMLALLEAIATKLIKAGGKIYRAVFLEGLIFQALAQVRMDKYALLLQADLMLTEIEPLINRLFNSGYSGSYGWGSVNLAADQANMKKFLAEAEFNLLKNVIIPAYRTAAKEQLATGVDNGSDHSPPGSDAGSQFSNGSAIVLGKKKKKKKTQRTADIYTPPVTSASSSSSISSKSTKGEMQSLMIEEDHDDTVIPTIPSTHEVEKEVVLPVTQILVQEEIIEVPKKVTYEVQNKAAVAELKEYRTPGCFLVGNLAITNYEQAVSEVGTWLKENELMTAHALDWPQYQKVVKQKKTELKDAEEKILAELGGYFAIVDSRFKAEDAAGHVQLLDISELRDNIRGVKFAPYERLSSSLNEATQDIKSRFSQLQEDLQKELRRDEQAKVAADDASSRVIATHFASLLPVLQHHENYLHHYAKTRFGVLKTAVMYFYAHNVDHTDGLHSGRQLTPEQKAVAKLLFATTFLRHSLMRLQPSPPVIQDTWQRFNDLSVQQQADQATLATYYYYNPIKSTARKTLEAKMATQEAELARYRAAAGQGAEYSPNRLRDNFEKVADPELLLWMGIKSFEDHCAVYYNGLANRGQTVILNASKQALGSFFQKAVQCSPYLAMPTPLSSLQTRYNNAHEVPKREGSVMDNCLAFVFDGVRPTKSSSTGRPVRFDHSVDYTRSQLDLQLDPNHGRNSTTSGSANKQSLTW